MNRPVIIDFSNPGTENKSQLCKGKFLQLRWRDQEYLLFADFGHHRYHNQILASFCESHTIPCEWLGEYQLQVEDPALEVLGGGRFHLDVSRKTLNLCDNSQIFGRFQEKGLKEKIAAANHSFSEYEVNISWATSACHEDTHPLPAGG